MVQGLICKQQTVSDEVIRINGNIVNKKLKKI